MIRGGDDRGSVQTRGRRRVSTEENETVLVRSQELRRARAVRESGTAAWVDARGPDVRAKTSGSSKA
jgi:hypothetical protein